MKILLVYKVDADDLGSSGVVQKMYDQNSAIQRAGHDVELAYLRGNKIIIGESVCTIENTQRKYFIKNIHFFQVLAGYTQSHRFDIIYIRYPFSNPYFLHWLAQIGKIHPQCKIVIEVSTFPYHKEFDGFGKISLILDWWYRRFLKKYVDRIVLVGQHDELWGIKTIKITNGINVSRKEIIYSKRKKSEIRLVAVGNWKSWHGLDRLISGMGQYYLKHPSVRITLDVIGGGSVVQYYKQQVQQLKLEKYVVFHGDVQHDQLDRFFHSADIGIGTLGNHRIGLTEHSPLKHREYCSYGLPFILSAFDKDFQRDLDFVQYHPSDDSPISCELLLDFYDQTSHIQLSIRNYAIQNLSWEKRMDDIMDMVVKD
ncbi:MAG: glycosyltransferase family 4 protein [Saprospiraceae bacterium]|nr:glycosyltransferase family 4 protein [Saprospiraceae bacterium]